MLGRSIRKEIVKCSPARSEVSNSPLISICIEPQKGNVSKNEVSWVQPLHESLALSRLTVPKPSVFIEWSTSFKAFIERQCSSPAERLFYLQK